MTEGITSSLGLFFSKMAMEKAEAIGKCCDNIQWSAGPTQVGKLGCDENSSDTPMKDQECIKEMKEIHAYLDMVKEMVRPGCSQEMLKVALNSMASPFNTLTSMSSEPRPYASL
ncbi:pyrophosphate--fructose 6-phosphate 1-phosphotransferase subunit alpha isoform X6 [Jatropha curcas]|uniref:pyrophosphate--fructose 6-phosphate 1-phosphotransferase subunit alpha isoform X6 n=1 Tax=Jatropha curcas TaxID=180498 RepID=UPI0005FB0E01|nr:pyrophosphate--fructose 6-phosphate 1-phosphotransferase subunit alpha isoform X6 [Jatropha curcas]